MSQLHRIAEKKRVLATVRRGGKGKKVVAPSYRLCSSIYRFPTGPPRFDVRRIKIRISQAI